MTPPLGPPEGKKRKREILEYMFLGDTANFPRLAEPTKEKEEFIRISSLVAGRPMMSLNQFIVKREITRIAKSWSKFGRTREGDILLKVKGAADIEKLKKMTHIGQWQVSITKDLYKNCVKGVVYSRDLVYLTDEEVLEAFDGWCIDNNKSYRVKSVYVPKKAATPNDSNKNNTGNTKEITGTVKTDNRINIVNNGQNEATKGTPRPFGLVIITFDALELPSRIGYGFDALEVRPYVPNPMRCQNCQTLGHTKTRCHSPTICAKCGKPESEGHACEGEFCVNCNVAGHLASNRACQSYLVWKEYEEIQVKLGCERYEAKKHFHSLYENADSYIRAKNLKVANMTNEKTINKQIKPKDTEGNKGIRALKPKKNGRTKTVISTPENVKRREDIMAQLGSVFELAQDTELMKRQTEKASQEVVSFNPNLTITNNAMEGVEENVEVEETTMVDTTNVSTNNNKNITEPQSEEETLSDEDNIINVSMSEGDTLLSDVDNLDKIQTNINKTNNTSDNKKTKKKNRKKKKEESKETASESSSDADPMGK